MAAPKQAYSAGGLKTEEQHVCTKVPPLHTHTHTFPALSRKQNNKAGDDDYKKYLGMAKAHSPSGSPHSVHFDSKQGPERNNRRLITHM